MPPPPAQPPNVLKGWAEGAAPFTGCKVSLKTAEAKVLQNAIGAGRRTPPSLEAALPGLLSQGLGLVLRVGWWQAPSPADTASLLHLPLSGTSMMVENSAVSPAPHPSAILSLPVVMLLLVGYLGL